MQSRLSISSTHTGFSKMAEIQKIKNSVRFDSKISDLYKYCAEGWSVTMSEAKAGLNLKTAEYDVYKDSEHYTRVRKVYGKKSHSYDCSN
jgi:hypothetical protein